jgi:hypothetical protein
MNSQATPTQVGFADSASLRSRLGVGQAPVSTGAGVREKWRQNQTLKVSENL